MLFLDGPTLDRLYPCRLKVAPDGAIEVAGPSLLRLLGDDILSRRFDDLFCVREPNGELGSPWCGGTIVIETRAPPHLSFAGSVAPNHRGGADLLMAVLATSALGGDTPLRYVDFAPTDNAIDVLMAMHTRDALMEDARRLSNDLAHARAAEAANRAKTQFLANISHELRTPLNAIIGYAEMVLEDVGDLGAPSTARDTRHILDSAHHLLALINKMLDLAKIEAGHMDLEVLEVDFAAIVREAVSVVEPVAAKSGNTISVEASPDVVFGFTDPTKLRQCLLNLLANAIKFTGGGEIRVTLGLSKCADVDMVEIVVTDTGCGMDEDLVRNLFAPFIQASASTARTHGGTGLGLAITRQLSRLLGGEVTVSSSPGVGSRFALLVSRDCTLLAGAPHERAPVPASAA